ncbi:MAG: hypothetical protein ACYC7K_00450 [Desulfobacteria bacterium]
MNAAQRLAVCAFLAGKSDEGAAKACGRSRETVNQWRNHDARFIAELNKERNRLASQIMARLRTRMITLTGAAFDGVASALKRGDSRVAMWWLDLAGIDEHAKKIFEQTVNPEIHPEDIDAVIDEIAARRVDEFMAVKGIPAIERLRVKEALTVKEAEALREENANPKPKEI